MSLFEIITVSSLLVGAFVSIKVDITKLKTKVDILHELLTEHLKK
jgi:hypothetical protein